MAVRRQVPLPLARDPDLLWGLSAADVLWPLAGAAVDLGVWKLAGHRHPFVTAIACGGLGAIALGLAWIRVEGRKVPQWTALAVGFWLRPHLYLPGSDPRTRREQEEGRRHRPGIAVPCGGGPAGMRIRQHHEERGPRRGGPEEKAGTRGVARR